MEIKKNIIINGLHGKPLLADLFYVADNRQKPVVIYAHGFNGFKDWGNFDLIARQFAAAGFVFIKFNFSHNGTTTEYPEEFADQKAYSENNYTMQLDDLGIIIDWVFATPLIPQAEADTQKINLVGHSLGGGLVILKTAQDARISRVATWAAVNECTTPWETWTDEKMAEWKKTGLAHITNSRTKQDMPLKYQLYENYINNSQRLNIQENIKKIKSPVLICHGLQDSSVPVDKAYKLKEWQPSAELFTVDSDHVFGRKHPWTAEELPSPMQAVLDRTIAFLKIGQKAGF